MKVRDLIELLAKQDQEAEVYVIEHRAGTGYYDQGGSITEVLFDENEHLEYTDFRGNQFVTPDKAYFNARHILLGATDI